MSGYKKLVDISLLMKYNNPYKYRRIRDEKCLYSNIYAGIDVDGSILPSYSSCYSDDIVRKIFSMGSVKDDFDIITKKRKTIFDILNTNANIECPSVCSTCDAFCTVIPWDMIKNDLKEYNSVPIDKHCELHKLITECLSK